MSLQLPDSLRVRAFFAVLRHSPDWELIRDQAAEIARLTAHVNELVEVAHGLADQQAVPDDWWIPKVRAAIKAVQPLSDETWTETHHKTLKSCRKAWDDHYAVPSVAPYWTITPMFAAIRAALAEIARLTAELEKANSLLKLRGY